MHYKILGIPKDATLQDIKQAYRTLAKQYHPDTNQTTNTDDMFKLINDAYSILSDTIKRKKYDQMTSNITHKNIKKTFNHNQEITLDVSLKQTILGDSIIFTNIYKCECTNCYGAGNIFNNCLPCAGTGVIKKNDSFISIDLKCKDCNGTGKKEITPCTICNCSGYSLKEEQLTLSIPEGLEKKTKLLMKGKGNLIGQTRGDLIVSINITDTENYTRKSNDLIYQVYIDVLDILIEQPLTIDTIKGTVSILIGPDNYQEPYIINGWGTKSLNGIDYGDMIIEIKPVINKLTNLQKEKLVNLKG